MKRWWIIDVKVPGFNARYLGRLKATEEEVRHALGPYIDVTGNHVLVWGRPPERRTS